MCELKSVCSEDLDIAGKGWGWCPDGEYSQ